MLRSCSSVPPQRLETTTILNALAFFDRERENLLAEVEWAFGAGEWSLMVSLAGDLAPFFNLRALWADWEATHRWALEAVHRGDDRHGEARALMNLVNVYSRQGHWKEAIGCYKQALETFRAPGRPARRGTDAGESGHSPGATGPGGEGPRPLAEGAGEIASRFARAPADAGVSGGEMRCPFSLRTETKKELVGTEVARQLPFSPGICDPGRTPVHPDGPCKGAEAPQAPLSSPRSASGNPPLTSVCPTFGNPARSPFVRNTESTTNLTKGERR
ncbi:MAG: tetratricopeptide repeat protein [Anaerolineae bacterium]|nr:tetratricopeptide repeat protein [Anaerolineae bacterium]